MGRDKVSVIIPTFNCEKYIAQSIESVLAKDWPDMEIVVQDNASTDNTYNIECQYARKYPEKITLFNNVVNLGGGTQNIYTALPYLLRSNGFIYFFSGDDIMYPGCIRRCVRAAERFPSAGLFLVERDEIDMQGRPLKYKPFYDRTFFCEGRKHAPVMMMSGITTLSQIMVRKLYFRLDKISLIYLIPTDWYLNFSMAMTADTVYLHEPGIAYRRAEGNETSYAVKSTMQIVEHYQMLLDFIRVAKNDEVPAVYDRQGEAMAHLAQMALRYAGQMLVEGLADTALDYLDLAVMIDPSCEYNDLYKKLFTCVSCHASDKPIDSDLLNTSSRNISYPPPDGFVEFSEEREAI